MMTNSVNLEEGPCLF